MSSPNTKVKKHVVSAVEVQNNSPMETIGNDDSHTPRVEPPNVEEIEMQTHAKPDDRDCMLEGSAKEIPEHGDIDFHVGDDGVLNHSFDEIDTYEEAHFDKPRVSVALSWHDVKITAAEMKGKSVVNKTILDVISGCVMPG